MTFNVRDWVTATFRDTPMPQRTTEVRPDPRLEGIVRALADQAEALRKKYPKRYLRVDSIKRHRAGEQRLVQFKDDAQRLDEHSLAYQREQVRARKGAWCLWCGDDIDQPPTGRARKFCRGSACRKAHERWKRRRALEGAGISTSAARRAANRR